MRPIVFLAPIVLNTLGKVLEVEVTRESQCGFPGGGSIKTFYLPIFDAML